MMEVTQVPQQRGNERGAESLIVESAEGRRPAAATEACTCAAKEAQTPVADCSGAPWEFCDSNQRA